MIRVRPTPFTFFRTSSISRKLILIILVIIVPWWILQGLIQMLLDFQSERSSLVDSLETNAEVISDSLRIPLLFDVAQDAERQLNSLRHNPDINGARVYRSDHSVFTGFVREGVLEIDFPGTPRPGLYHHDSRLSICRPIAQKGQTIGYLYMEANMTSVWNNFRQELITMLVITLLSSLVAFSFVLALRRMISDPIEALSEAMKGITEEADYSLRVEIDRDDEIGQLYRGFNDMLRQISLRSKQRDQAEAKLKKSEATLNKIIESAPNPIMVFRANGEILQINRAWLEGAGCSSNGDRTVFDWIERASREKDRTALKVRLKHAGSWHTQHYRREINFLTTEGESRTWDVQTAVLLDDTDEEVVVAIANDITNRKIAETEIRALNLDLEKRVEERTKLLRNLNLEMEQIVYVVSHDLRSPLINVYGYSRELDLALKEIMKILPFEEIGAERHQQIREIIDNDITPSLDFIMSSSMRMDKLLDGLLAYSRLGRSNVNPRNLNMNEVVEETCADFSYKIKKQGIQLTVEALPEAYADRDQTKQAFANILANAIKYLDPHRPGKISIRGREESHRAIFAIEDNGIGIEESHQSKIFELFHRLQPRDTEGEGLGLTVVKKIVERNGGDVWLTSRQGVGTTFFVSLPRGNSLPSEA